MKLLTTFLALFAALSFSSIVYSATNEQAINDQINIQLVTDETEQTENDEDDSEC